MEYVLCFWNALSPIHPSFCLPATGRRRRWCLLRNKATLHALSTADPSFLLAFIVNLWSASFTLTSWIYLNVYFISKYQRGFLKRSSCERQLMFTNDLFPTLDRNSGIDCIFLNFEKALDTFCHRVVLLNLSSVITDHHLLTAELSVASTIKSNLWLLTAPVHVSAS